jgi:hypothetical protein
MAHQVAVMRHDDMLEKRPVSLRENVDGSQDGSAYECEFSEREQKKIIHRIDRRLVVTVGVLYCISLMDRTNLSAAAIAGFVDDTAKLAPSPC